MLRVICQTEEDKYCMLLHIWNLKNITKACNKIEADSDIDNKLVVISGERGWGRGKLGVGLKRYKILGSNFSVFFYIR